MNELDLSQAVWQKSSRSSANGQCVEVAFLDAVIAVRDSKNPDGPALVFTPGEWNAFVDGVAAGELHRL